MSEPHSPPSAPRSPDEISVLKARVWKLEDRVEELEIDIEALQIRVNSLPEPSPGILDREPAQLIAGAQGLILGFLALAGYEATTEERQLVAEVLAFAVPALSGWLAGRGIRAKVTPANLKGAEKP